MDETAKDDGERERRVDGKKNINKTQRAKKRAYRKNNTRDRQKKRRRHGKRDRERAHAQTEHTNAHVQRKSNARRETHILNGTGSMTKTRTCAHTHTHTHAQRDGERCTRGEKGEGKRDRTNVEDIKHINTLLGQNREREGYAHTCMNSR